MCTALLTACANPDTAGPAPTLATDQNPEAIARRLIAEDTGAAPEDIIILSVNAVKFSDSSLDCPKPDMAYLQVITPGHKVIASTATDSTRLLDVRLSDHYGFICKPQGKSLPAR
ncbi:MAG: hypothetical protein GY779_10355 [Gammaproteobacteria bacterium]|nr:hypothetical protein [Gammaproteobacteria bacterium]